MGREETNSRPSRIAHAGGQITTNKESALHAFVLRRLREGKPLSQEQRWAAEQVGVDVRRLMQLHPSKTSQVAPTKYAV
jgi:hypothetical protein